MEETPSQTLRGLLNFVKQDIQKAESDLQKLNEIKKDLLKQIITPLSNSKIDQIEDIRTIINRSRSGLNIDQLDKTIHDGLLSLRIIAEKLPTATNAQLKNIEKILENNESIMDRDIPLEIDQEPDIISLDKSTKGLKLKPSHADSTKMLISEASGKRSSTRTLAEKKSYLHKNLYSIRVVDSIKSNRVYYYDQVGPGNCTKQVFLVACPTEATPEEIKFLEQQKN